MSGPDEGHVLDEWWAWARGGVAPAERHDRCEGCREPVRRTFDGTARLVTIADASPVCRGREIPSGHQDRAMRRAR